jgi:hypothetical protein
MEAVALSASPYDYRVIEDLEDLDDTGTEELHRAILVDDFNPVANAGVPLDFSLNSGPDDSNAATEDAAAFHILRNSVLAAQYILSLGRFVEPLTAVYDRDTALVNNSCQRRGSFYNGAGRYMHLQSTGPNVPQQLCPAGEADSNGICAVACQDSPDGLTYDDSRADFNYDTHLHEFSHHLAHVLTSIGTWKPDGAGDRATGSHFGNSSEKTSLSEGLPRPSERCSRRISFTGCSVRVSR